MVREKKIRLVDGAANPPGGFSFAGSKESGGRLYLLIGGCDVAKSPEDALASMAANLKEKTGKAL